MEQELQRYLDTYESTHNYDEYHFDLDDIEHDPYVLISILSALHEGEFTLDEVQSTLQMLFEKQYILTEEVIVETRYRTETDTWTDADGNTHTETYRVPYEDVYKRQLLHREHCAYSHRNHEQPRMGQHRHKLAERLVRSGISGLPHHGLRRHLCCADQRHDHRRQHSFGSVLCGSVHGYSVLLAVQDRKPCKIHLPCALRRSAA